MKASGVTSELYQSIAANEPTIAAAAGDADRAAVAAEAPQAVAEEAEVAERAEQPVREQQLPQLAVAADR